MRQAITLASRRDSHVLFPPRCCSPRSRWPSPPEPRTNALDRGGPAGPPLFVHGLWWRTDAQELREGRAQSRAAAAQRV